MFKVYYDPKKPKYMSEKDNLNKTQETDSSKKTLKTESKPKRSNIKKIFLIFCSALLLFIIGISLKFIHDINNPAALFDDSALTSNLNNTPKKPALKNSLPTASLQPTPLPEEYLLSQSDLEFMKNRVNILVLGIDESTERESWGSFRTDTMILISIDFDTLNVDMISVPRDSYVKLYNHKGEAVFTGELVSLDGGITYTEGLKYAKINSAFPAGGGAKKHGFEYAMNTVSHLLGSIPVNYYVGFNMNVVKEVVNAMGGVDYNVDINVEMNGRYLYPGMQHMNGQAVLDYCRMRKGSSDIARVDRQQRMLMAIFEQLKSTGQIANIPSIYTAVQQNIKTNLSFTQISSLALLALKMDAAQLNRYTIPGDFLNIQKVSYWGIHSKELALLIKDIFGKNVNPDMEIDIDRILAVDAANRQAIAVELGNAQTALDEAEALKTKYNSEMSKEQKALLKDAMDKVQEAIDEADKLMLDTYTPQLQQLTAFIKSAFEPVPQPTSQFVTF